MGYWVVEGCQRVGGLQIKEKVIQDHAEVTEVSNCLNTDESD